MRHKILALAVLAAAAMPVGAEAQRVIVEDGVTTGMAGVPVGGGIITEPYRPAFRQYIVEEQVPSYTVNAPIAVGTVLPESGVTYYDVPQRFGATPYRYTVVNGETVLVEPRSRRIVQVVD